MARKPNQVRKKKKQYLDFLKQLTKWLTTTPRNKEKIANLLHTYDIDASKLLLRISSYCYNQPRLIWYINKYFNNLYEMYKMDPIQLAFNLTLLLDMNHHNKPTHFYFLKSNDLKDNNKKIVLSLLKRYALEVHMKSLNSQELNYYYHLFQNDIITEQHLKDIDILLNTESTIKLDPIIKKESNSKEFSEEQYNQYFENMKVRELPIPIKSFNESLIKGEHNTQCTNCKLNKNQRVGIDTNLETPGEVDFAFIGLNPGKDERLFMRPFIGRSGKLQRKKMYQMHPNTKWIILNTMLCSTNNQKEIGKTDKEVNNTARNCIPNLQHILQNFNAKYYVLIGKPAMNVFGFKKPIVSSSGEIIINENGARFIPLVHPSAVIQYHGQMEEAFNYGFDQIINLSYELYKNETVIEQPTTQTDVQTDVHSTVNQTTYKNKYNIPPEKIITSPTEDMTFMDSIDINGYDAVLIFIDGKGIKKYMFTTYEMPIYIKNKDWKDCDILTNDADYVVKINGRNRYQLSQNVRENLTLKQKTSVK